jgi:hypothetical protein
MPSLFADDFCTTEKLRASSVYKDPVPEHESGLPLDSINLSDSATFSLAAPSKVRQAGHAPALRTTSTRLALRAFRFCTRVLSLPAPLVLLAGFVARPTRRLHTLTVLRHLCEPQRRLRSLAPHSTSSTQFWVAVAALCRCLTAYCSRACGWLRCFSLRAPCFRHTAHVS